MASSSAPSSGSADYRTELASTDADALTVAVVRGIAAVRKEHPAELDFQLYDYLDLDAVESLYAGGTEWELGAEIEGHAVTLRGDGTLLID